MYGHAQKVTNLISNPCGQKHVTNHILSNCPKHACQRYHNFSFCKQNLLCMKTYSTAYHTTRMSIKKIKIIICEIKFINYLNESPFLSAAKFPLMSLNKIKFKCSIKHHIYMYIRILTSPLICNFFFFLMVIIYYHLLCDKTVWYCRCTHWLKFDFENGISCN